MSNAHQRQIYANPMTVSITQALRAFEQADAAQRDHMLRLLVDRINDDEAASLDAYLGCRRRRFDILGNLPTELRLYVVDHLDTRDLYLYTLVCRRWRGLFLHSDTVITHLLSTRFASPLDGSRSSNDDDDDDDDDENSDQQRLVQALRIHHLRATGRFRTRLTLPLKKKRGGLFFAGRLSSRQHGDDTFQDLTCADSSSMYISPDNPNNPLDYSSLVSVLYSHGRVSWQTSTNAMTVHDLRTHQQRVLRPPHSAMVGGLSPKQSALGDKLLIAVFDDRKIYGWCLDTGTVAHITIPSRADDFLPHGFSVLITCSDGTLYLWDYPHRVRQVDTTTLPSRLHLRSNPVFHHPTDPAAFFVVSYWAQPWHDSRMLLFLHEFRSGPTTTATTTACFRHDVAAYLQHQDQLADLDDGPDVVVEQIDNNGTFQLLTFTTTTTTTIDAETSSSRRRSHHVTFNTLTATFGILVYDLTPWDPRLNNNSSSSGRDQDDAESFFWNSVGMARLWEGQMLFPVQISASTTAAGYCCCYPTGMVALNPVCLNNDSTCDLTVDDGQSLSAAVNTSLVSFIRGTGGHGAGDIIRHPRHFAGSGSCDCHSLCGFAFACRLAEDACSFPGPHAAYCERNRRPLDSVLLGRDLTDRRRSAEHTYRGTPYSPGPTRLYVDDEFVILATHTSYTVFYVDPDGKVADSIKTATLAKEQEERASDQ